MFPGQIQGPQENGMKAKGDLCFPSGLFDRGEEGSNQEGRNSSGFCHCSGWI